MASAMRTSVLGQGNSSRPYLPFPKLDQLVQDMDLTSIPTFLPGNPRVRLDNHQKLGAFLRRDLGLGDLATMAPRLWMMTAPGHFNISALHRQKVKGREIVVTEEHRLHLVWYYDRIYIKPLPRYLLSAKFWQEYFAEIDTRESSSNQDRLSKAALGYLRSYALLIRHESDFRVATRDDLQLIPKDVSWEHFCIFIRHFENLPDASVAERYHYGEIRLSRLNFYAKFFLGKAKYQRIHLQYSDYFNKYFTMILFLFAVVTTFLNAMQVELAAEAFLTNQWESFSRVARYFSVVVLFLTLIIVLWLFGLFMYKFCKEWYYALKVHYSRKNIVNGSA